MISTLLSTKFYIPSARVAVSAQAETAQALVPRSSLIDRLNNGLERKLTLLSAPAGYGKSTLLGEWAHQVKCPVAWLSLDKRDNIPSRFWSYFAAALRIIPALRDAQVGEDLLELEDVPQSHLLEESLTNLVAEIDRHPGRFILVLDDLHLVTDPLIHEGLTFLLEHLPPAPGGMHLAVASRTDPPWSLARWRVRGDISEVRAADLRFTPVEAALFLNEVKGLSLSSKDISVLDQRTEGWIAGLNMAALSMQGCEDVAAFLDKFSGSHTFILDYLLEEVLNQQKPEVLDFLLKTSLLERLTAPLCDAVMGRAGSQAVLTQLEKSNAFLVPLDDERGWYRYHHLFGDFLRKRFTESFPAQVQGIILRASQWCEANDFHQEAIHYALDAGDMEQAAHLVTANILLMAQSHHLTELIDHLNALPQKDIRSRPWLCVAFAWVKTYAGQLEGADVLVRQVEETLSQGEIANQAERAHLSGHALAVRAYTHWILGHAGQAVEAARQSLLNLPASDPAARAHVLLILGLALQYQSDFTASFQSFQDSIDISRSTGNLFLEIYASSCLAYGIVETGQLHRAFHICEETIKESAQYKEINGSGQQLSLGFAYATRSDILWLWGDLNGALAAAQQAVALSEQWRQADNLHYALISLVRSSMTVGDMDAARSALARATRIARKVSSDWFITISAYHEAVLNLACGNLNAAEQWLQQFSDGEAGQTPPHAAMANILVALGRYSEALVHLDTALPKLEASGHWDAVLQALILKALAFSGQGQAELALQTLKTALVRAEPEGYIQVFVCKGEPMALLLRQTLKRGILPGYVHKLLAEMAKQDALKRGTTIPEPVITPGQGEGLIEPLSERELEVLRLLSTRLSAPEIAQQLYVAHSTVRTHIRNIYAKLSVHRRTDAVQQAKLLKLV